MAEAEEERIALLLQETNALLVRIAKALELLADTAKSKKVGERGDHPKSGIDWE